MIIIGKGFVMLDMMLVIFKDKICNPIKNNFYDWYIHLLILWLFFISKPSFLTSKQYSLRCLIVWHQGEEIFTSWLYPLIWYILHSYLKISVYSPFSYLGWLSYQYSSSTQYKWITFPPFPQSVYPGSIHRPHTCIHFLLLPEGTLWDSIYPFPDSSDFPNIHIRTF